MAKKNSQEKPGILGLFEKYKKQIIAIILVLHMTLVYKLIQSYNSYSYTLKTPFDDMIPFMPLFVLPYLLYIAVILAPLIMSWKDNKMFLAVSSSFLFAAVICNILFIVFPTAIHRPEVVAASIFDRLVLFVYSIDSIVNCFPSEHVAFSLLACLCMWHINRRAAYVLGAITAFIIPATLLIKQHYIPDIFGGIALALICYFFVFRLLIRKETKAKGEETKFTRKEISARRKISPKNAVKGKGKKTKR